MKQSFVRGIALALLVAAAFGIGMWFMYFIMWADVFVKFIEMAERVFK